MIETLNGLQRRNSTGKLFLLHDVRPSYAYETSGKIQVYRLAALDPAAKLRAIATEVLASPESVLYTHMIDAGLLRTLWEYGIKTVPVFQNSRQAWLDDVSTLRHANVPFVVAVSKAVERQIVEDGCRKPVVTIRHELQRWFSPEEERENRRQIRHRYGIPDNAVLIGMVGAFKAQKGYTRAVRVLRDMSSSYPAKLMILGAWDHDWGYGRQAYTAAYRLALDLNVITDLITPGAVPDVERYYSAFDVFLNTSAFEGLSVALLEAIQAGRPIVTSDAGGNGEVLPEGAVLVKDPMDIAAYVKGINQVLSHTTFRPPLKKVADYDLVPRLWPLFSRYGHADSFSPPAKRSGALFLTDHLDTGGEQRSLVDLLRHLSPHKKVWLGVLGMINSEDYLKTLEKNGIPVFSVAGTPEYMDRLERLLCMAQRLNIREICFWNLSPEMKLLLAKLLPAGAVRLVEVVYGSSSHAEMDGTTGFQRRIAFNTAEYWKRVDRVVHRLRDSGPRPALLDRDRITIIPDGIDTFPVQGGVPPCADRPFGNRFNRGHGLAKHVARSCRLPGAGDDGA